MSTVVYIVNLFIAWLFYHAILLLKYSILFILDNLGSALLNKFLYVILLVLNFTFSFYLYLIFMDTLATNTTIYSKHRYF